MGRNRRQASYKSRSHKNRSEDTTSGIRTEWHLLKTNFIVFSSFRYVYSRNPACKAVDSRHKHAGMTVEDYQPFLKLSAIWIRTHLLLIEIKVNIKALLMCLIKFCGLLSVHIIQHIHALYLYEASVKICSRKIFQDMFRDEWSLHS